MDNKYTKRARIFTGTGCNAKCRFCYYYLTGLKDYWSENIIKREINIAKNAGMKAIDFSGGEPTVHPKFLGLIEYARSKGFKVICTLTNGIRMSDEKFVKKIVDAGINDVLFSVHGCNPQEHDFITQIPKSFDKIIKAIYNLKEYDIPFRINCTVTKINYKNLERHAELYNRLEPIQVNFILFNDFELADRLTEQFAIRYSEASVFVKKAIDVMEATIPYINVRYIPFCFMEGYEDHVCNYPQKIFDPFEWSQRMLVRLPSTGIMPFWKYIGYLVYGFVRTHPKPKLCREYLEDICIAMRIRDYVKSDACKECKFSNICQGLEKSYVKIFGTVELKPVAGEPIKDPLYFRHNFYRGYKYGD